MKDNRIFQFLRFGMVGLMNNVVSLAVYYGVIYFHKDWYLFGNALGFFVSTWNAYFWNSRFVFRVPHSAGQGKKHLLKTYCVYILSLCISTLLLFLLVDIAGIDKRLAPICALLVTVPFNYLMNRVWIYR